MSDLSEIVMYLIVRNDLGMSPGKAAAQVGHGVELAKDTGSRLGSHWMPVDLPCAKIVLQANIQEISKIFYDQIMLRDGRSLLMVKVIDEGRTEIEPNTLTVLATVPAPKHIFMDTFKHLKLY